MFAYIAEENVLKKIDVKTPVFKEDEVLIDVYYSGVNRPDLLQKEGLYLPPKGVTPILGLEVAGIVKAVGKNCTKFAVGDQVCALLPGGGYADQVAAFEDHVLPIPKNLSLYEASGILEVFATVWLNLIHYGQLKFGESCFIHAGGSGIAMAAIQVAKWVGADVVTATRSERKAEIARAYGADAVLDYRHDDFIKWMEKEYPDGFDVVLDILGGDYFAQNLEMLGFGGRHLSIAFLTGAVASVKIPLIMQKSLHLMGSLLRPRSWEEKARLLDEVQKNLWPAFSAKELKVEIDRLFPFEALEEAFAYMKASEHCGKIILDHGKND